MKSYQDSPRNLPDKPLHDWKKNSLNFDWVGHLWLHGKSPCIVYSTNTRAQGRVELGFAQTPTFLIVGESIVSIS